MKTVFVTVGTTSFDELIETITSSDAVQVSDPEITLGFGRNNI